jgi:hypothetical protein
VLLSEAGTLTTLQTLMNLNWLNQSQRQLTKRGVFPDMGSVALFYLRLAFLFNYLTCEWATCD